MEKIPPFLCPPKRKNLKKISGTSAQNWGVGIFFAFFQKSLEKGGKKHPPFSPFITRGLSHGLITDQPEALDSIPGTCTLKTSYDLKTLPCSSHRSGCKEPRTSSEQRQHGKIMIPRPARPHTEGRLAHKNGMRLRCLCSSVTRGLEIAFISFHPEGGVRRGLHTE